jgi:hypothetical protein
MVSQIQTQNQIQSKNQLEMETIRLLNSYKVQFTYNNNQVWIKSKFLVLNRDPFEISVKQSKNEIVYVEREPFNFLIVRRGVNGDAVTLPKTSTAFYVYPYLVVILS